MSHWDLAAGKTNNILSAPEPLPP